MAAEMKLETYLQTVSTGNHFVKGECEILYFVMKNPFFDEN
jgi:hypothetical protein